MFTIVFRYVRTVTTAQDSYFLLYFSNIIIATLKINLLLALASEAHTSLIATTSPVSL